MRILYRNLFKNQNGQAMVEFALVMPLLLLIICGIIEFGFLFSNQLMISNLSREGARYGVIYSKDPNQLQIVKDKIISLIPTNNKDKYTIEVSYSNTTTPRSGDIIVKITYKATPLTPITGIFTNGVMQLSSKSVMKLE